MDKLTTAPPARQFGKPMDMGAIFRAISTEAVRLATEIEVERRGIVLDEIGVSVSEIECRHHMDEIVARGTYRGFAIGAAVTETEIRAHGLAVHEIVANLSSRLADAILDPSTASDAPETSPVASFVPDDTHQEPRTTREIEDDGFTTIHPVFHDLSDPEIAAILAGPQRLESSAAQGLLAAIRDQGQREQETDAAALSSDLRAGLAEIAGTPSLARAQQVAHELLAKIGGR